MSVSSFRAASAYRETMVESRSPLELISMLYDGLIRSVTQARDAMARGDLKEKHIAQSRALRVMHELQHTLDRDKGGDLAKQLEGLYTYVTSRLLEANANKDVAAYDEALRLMLPLRDAWAQIAGSPGGLKGAV
jgi:flagellar protein FliS